MNTDMKKKTTLQWLYAKLYQMPTRDEVSDLVYQLEEEAKAMEKEQMTTFAKMWESKIFDGSIDSVDDYYNETYGGDK